MTSRSPARRRTIASARALAAAAALSLIAASAQAQTSRDCLYVDSRQGWQALPAPAGRVVDLSADGTWSVFPEQVEPVSIKGHTGEAGKRLAPWASYKYDQSYAFGALLYRTPGGASGSFAELASKFWLSQAAGRGIPEIGALDLRINDADAGLHNNAGRIRVCLIYLPTG